MKMARLAALTIVIAVGACGNSDDEAEPGEQPGRQTVVLKDIAFTPGTLSVKTGDTVTWKFEDKGIAHNVVANDGSFKSDTKDSGTFEHTFAKAGTFEYSCTVHPGMDGTVKVT